eukprot:6289804-Amphidinium_carterae.3
MPPQEADATMHPSGIIGDFALGACTGGRVDALPCGHCVRHVGSTDYANSEFVSAFLTLPVSHQPLSLVTGHHSEHDALSAGQALAFSCMHASPGASCCDGASYDFHSGCAEAAECNPKRRPQAVAQQTPINVPPTQDVDVVDTIAIITLNVLSLAGGEESQNNEHERGRGRGVPPGDKAQPPSWNPAAKGIGGLVIAIAKKDGHEVLHHKCIGPRVLAALVKLNGKPFFILCAHAPIRKAPESEHVDFALAIETALGDKPKAAKLLGGADLNARVAQQEDGITISGPLASKCPYTAIHARSLMRVLQRHQVHLDSIVTWQHPRTKKEYQIDFVLANTGALEEVTACGTQAWAHYDMLTRSDHRAVKATFLASRANHKRGLRVVRKHSSEAHLQAFKAKMASAMSSYKPCNSSTPFAVTKDLQKVAIATLAATRPKAAQPRSSWISEHTWTLMRRLNQLRKIHKECRHHSRGANKWLFPVLLDKVPGFDDDSFPRTLTPDVLAEWGLAT